MKLYEIDRSIQDILDNMNVDPDTGEVTMDEEGLAALQMAREAKLEGVALAVKNMSAEADAIRAEEKALAERRRVLENKTENLKGFLLDALKGEKLETARVKVTSQKGRASCVVEDATKVSEWSWALWRTAKDLNDEKLMAEYERIDKMLQIEYQPPKLSKAGVKQLLAEGVEIPGCHMETGKPSLRIQ